MNRKIEISNKQIQDAATKWNPESSKGWEGHQPDDEFTITRRLIIKTKIQNLWRKRVTSNPHYKDIKCRLEMIRGIISRKNGLVMFDVRIENGQYYVKINGTNLFTTNEFSEASSFLYGILKRRIDIANTDLRTQSLINEAKSILNAGHR